MVPLWPQSVGCDGELVVVITKPCEYASVVVDDGEAVVVVDAAVVVVKSSNCNRSSPYAAREGIFSQKKNIVYVKLKNKYKQFEIAGCSSVEMAFLTDARMCIGPTVQRCIQIQRIGFMIDLCNISFIPFMAIITDADQKSRVLLECKMMSLNSDSKCRRDTMPRGASANHALFSIYFNLRLL